MNARFCVVGLVGLLALVLPGVAAGQSGVYGWPYLPPYWGCYGGGDYSIQAVPYFALHPPVYYSYRVARTYGYSPFAYPPGVMTPGSESLQTAVVQNTSAAGGTPESTEAERGGPQPLRIDNPFVQQHDRVGTKGSPPPGRRPQVVYPAALAKGP
jgi:hypothetical protein